MCFLDSTEVPTTTFNSGCSEDTIKKATRNSSGYEEKARGVTEAEPPKKKLGRSRGRARKYVVKLWSRSKVYLKSL